MDEEVKESVLDDDYTEEPAVEENDNESSDNDEFEYDEDGNIIIPDIEEEEPESEEEEPVEEDEQHQADEAYGEPEAEQEKQAEEEPQTKQTDARDAEIESLKKRIREMESQSKDTLKKLGVKTDDVMQGLAKLAAEADGVSFEEYQTKRKTEQEDEEARQFVANLRFQEKMRADLAEVQAAYPETKKYKTMSEIPNFVRFGQLRDAGLTPKEAYIAANPDAVRESIANAVKQGNLNDTKSHLRSAVPKGSKDNSITMTKSELSQWRDLFPNKSDKEIMSLYRKTATTQK